MKIVEPFRVYVEALRTSVKDLGLSPYATARKLRLPDMMVRRFMAGGTPTLGTLGKIERALSTVSGAGFPPVERVEVDRSESR